MNPILRRATLDDLPALCAADGRAFGFHYSQQDIDDFRPMFDPERFVLACDPDGAIVGVTGSFDMTVALPGGTSVPALGVTWVSVAVTHQGRGILRSLMTEQHRSFVADGASLSMLTASQSGIYGRFGYGQATRKVAVEIDRRLVRFRAGVPDPGGVRVADVDDVRKHAPEIYRRWSVLTPGAVLRTDAWWEFLLADREQHRGGASGLFHLLHRDGYASYRIVDGDAGQRCRVEVFAATDEAYIALWRVLLGLKLVDTITSRTGTLDEPLPFLLEEPRLVTTTGLADGLWVRVLDVAAALAARTYAVEIDAVIEVRDGFLDRGGRFRLRGGPEGGTCERTTDTADVSLDIAELGSVLLGSVRAAPLVRAGLLQAEPAALARIDAAFTGPREARLGTGF
ncbi:GNAT family N-acetyltransferase [Pseudonocardia sp. GCM10023141]|uniref:GNAT family N-acetyltransferase n=1 Tax=Pseudonocardia sp. GCM10023141 TaxID=3252653 RepID=UPI00360AF5B3